MRGLGGLPVEILEIIYVYSQTDDLKYVSSGFYHVGSSLHISTKRILYKHGLWFPCCASVAIPIEKTLEDTIWRRRWLETVSDSNFDEKSALNVFSIGMNRDILLAFVEIATEFCAKEGYLELLHYLLLNAPGDSKGLSQELRNRTLVQTCILGCVDLSHLLLKFDADVHFDDDACFKMACKYGHVESAKLLLENGSDVHVEEEYALCWASRNGFLDIVQLLVEYGADINARRGIPIGWSSEYGRTNVVSYLLRQGVEIHFNDDYPIRWASVRGHGDTVTLLIDAQADIHAVQDFPIRNAIKFGHLEVVRLLLKAGGDPQACDGEAIHWAVEKGQTDIIGLLMEYITL